MKKLLALLFAAVLPLAAQVPVALQKEPKNPTSPALPGRLNDQSKVFIVPATGSITADPGGVIAATTIPTITIATTAPLTGGGALTGNLTLAIPAATGSINGYLTSTDWTTFNAKQPAGNYITALTGDGTAAGPGSVAFTLATVNANVGTFAAHTVNAKGLTTAAANLSGDLTTSGAVATLATVNSNVGTFAAVTVNGKGLVTAAANLSGDLTTSAAVATLATVNSNVGSFGSSTAIPVFTVNGKGLITAASTVVVIAPAGTLTGATLAANVLASSLTSVGTLTGGATGAGFTVALGTSTITGTLGVTNGGNGLATATLGDLRYGSGTNTLAALAGSTSATMVVLTQTGNGTVSAAPVWTSTIGTGNVVRATSPTLVTPTIGAATATSINGLILTASTGTFTLANLKTLTISNTLTFTGTDAASVNFGAGGTVLYSGGSYVSSITGTANQITASASTGAVTLSLPTTISNVNSITSASSTDLTLTANAGASWVLSTAGATITGQFLQTTNILNLTTSSGGTAPEVAIRFNSPSAASSSSRNWLIGNNVNAVGDFVLMRSTSNSANAGTAVLSFDLSGNAVAAGYFALQNGGATNNQLRLYNNAGNNWTNVYNGTTDASSNSSFKIDTGGLAGAFALAHSGSATFTNTGTSSSSSTGAVVIGNGSSGGLGVGGAINSAGIITSTATSGIVNSAGGTASLTAISSVNGAIAEVILSGKNSTGTAREVRFGINKFADDVASIYNGTTEIARFNLTTSATTLTGTLIYGSSNWQVSNSSGHLLNENVATGNGNYYFDIQSDSTVTPGLILELLCKAGTSAQRSFALGANFTTAGTMDFLASSTTAGNPTSTIGSVTSGGNWVFAGSAAVGTSLSVATTSSLAGAVSGLTVASSQMDLGADARATDIAIRFNTAAGNSRKVWGYTAGTVRWKYGVGGSSEAGANAGSNFEIDGYSDAGASLGTWLSIIRGTGVVTMPSTATASSTSTGALVIGNGSAGGLGVGGAAFIGGTLNVTGALTFGSSSITFNAGTPQLATNDGAILIRPITGNLDGILNVYASGTNTLAKLQLVGASTSAANYTRLELYQTGANTVFQQQKIGTGTNGTIDYQFSGVSSLTISTAAVTVASGIDLKLGRAVVASTPVGTGTVAMLDSTGSTVYVMTSTVH